MTATRLSHTPTMQEISKVEDSSHREELSKMILSEAGEIISMDVFKKQIEEQSDHAKQEFCSMIDDMECSINEGKEEELLMLMEHANDEEEEESCCDSDECSDECDDESDEESGLGSCGSEDDDCCDSDDDDDDDDDDQEGLTNDLKKDLARAESVESKKCCRSDQGCSGQCRCKGQCSSDA